MGKRSSGLRARSRRKLSHGEFSIAASLQEFKPGEKVVLDLNGAVHKGMPHQRFQGQQGTVLERRGRAFIIQINDHEKKKQIISRPEHLKKYQ